MSSSYARAPSHAGVARTAGASPRVRVARPPPPAAHAGCQGQPGGVPAARRAAGLSGSQSLHQPANGRLPAASAAAAAAAIDVQTAEGRTAFLDSLKYDASGLVVAIAQVLFCCWGALGGKRLRAGVHHS